MIDKQWELKPNKVKALMIAKRQLPEFVYDAVQLEGINFSFPEIQTLLDGITIGGHKLSDQQIAVNQGNTWRKIFDLVQENKFTINLTLICDLHKIAGKEEALTWGEFRNAMVYISGTNYSPPPSTELVKLFDQMIKSLDDLEDVYDKAIHLFLTMARTQFFYDVNKRMGRFIMNGFLLNEGFPAINLPAKRKLEFNTKMLTYYESADQKEMNLFLRTCLDPKIIQIMKE